MRVANLFPRGTPGTGDPPAGSSNLTVNGGLTAPAALNDDNDATSVDFNPSAASITLDLDDLTLNAGEAVYKVEALWRARTVDDGGDAWVRIQLVISGHTYELVSTPGGFEDATFSTRTAPIALTQSAETGGQFQDAEIDGMRYKVLTANIAGDTATRVRFARLWVNVTIIAQPVINVTGPAGTVTNPQPTVAWSFDGDTLPQTYYKVRVFTAAIAGGGGFDPDTSPAVWETNDVPSAAQSKQIGVALADGSYVAYVKAAQALKHWSAWDSSAFTVAHGPNTPTLVSPNSGSVLDTTAGVTLDWSYTHPSGVAQAAWAIRRKVDGGSAQYWRTSDDTWQSALVWNAGSVTVEDFPAGAFALGHTYAWAVAVTDGNGLTSAFSAENLFTASGPPTVSSVTPSGSVTTTTHPTIGWSYADTAGRPEATFRVKIYPLAVANGVGFNADSTPGAVYDSGTRAGPATSLATDYDLETSGAQYKVFVKVSAGGQSSGWASSTITINVPAPAAPSSINAAENPFVSGVDVTVTGAAGGGFSNVELLVERSFDAGATWELVRFPASGLTVTDYEAQPRTSIRYRARFRGTNGSGVRIAGAYSGTATVSTAPIYWILRDVQDPTKFAVVYVNDGLRIPHPIGAGVFDTVGSGDGEAIVISEPTERAARYTVELWVKTAAQRTAVSAMLRPGRTLLLQDVLDQQWYLQLVDSGATWEFLRSPHATNPREHAYKTSIEVATVGRPAVT